MKKGLPYERLVIFFAALVQIVGFVISVTIEDYQYSFLPRPEYVIPSVNALGALVCLFLLIFPRFKLLQSLVLFAQGITMTLNNLIFLGTFLYSAGVIFLFCNGFLKERSKKRLAAVLGVWFATLFVMLPQNFLKFCMVFAYSLFVSFFYFYVYASVRKDLLSLFPITAMTLSSVEMPELGQELHLERYQLTDRQIFLVQEYITTRKTYKELAETLKISESTVKKDMTDVFEKLGVQNIASLNVLLSQYKVMR